MRLLSVNVGMPRLLAWKDNTLKSGIFKKPVSGRVLLRTTNLDGDRQADLSVHGGPNKAVYGYPSEHYEYWHGKLPGVQLDWDALGENFTTSGLVETDIYVGDYYCAGQAVIAVTTPRLPCFKLAAKFQRDDMIERFLHSGRSGYYFSVVEQGEVGAGDELKLLERQDPTLTIAEMADLYTSALPDLEVLQRAVRVTAVPHSWRERFLARLAAAPGKKQTV
jgi:MOSC domain-containing protein YiiM